MLIDNGKENVHLEKTFLIRDHDDNKHSNKKKTRKDIDKIHTKLSNLIITLERVICFTSSLAFLAP